MNRFIFALCAGFILGCGNSSTGPEPEPVPNHEEGDLVITLPGDAKMAFVWIDPGTFMMGSPDSDKLAFDTEHPQHQVTITKGFYLSKYELTQRQWHQVMGTAPWIGRVDSIGPDFPASYFNWEGAQVYAKRLTTLQGNAKYRLPTEAEWEYACRAGTTTLWFFGDNNQLFSDYAWGQGIASGPQRVGTKLPNPLGLYDMYGNLYEWVIDWYSLAYPADPQIDPTGPPTSPHIPSHPPSRVIRGGSYSSGPRTTRSASRAPAAFIADTAFIGVRILREGPKVSQP